MQRGDIYRVALDPSLGHEQKGTRPVLVVSATAFNKLTGLPIVVPITSGGGFARMIGFAVSLKDAGILTTGIVRCEQPRPLDLRARKAKRVESVPPEILDEVLARVVPIFE